MEQSSGAYKAPGFPLSAVIGGQGSMRPPVDRDSGKGAHRCFKVPDSSTSPPSAGKTRACFMTTFRRWRTSFLTGSVRPSVEAAHVRHR